MAAIGMSFAGLSVLTMILGQMLGGQMNKFDGFVARSWVQLGFMITFGSILPPLLGLLALAANAIAVPVERSPGVYAASVTAILIGATLLFLFAFVHWYEALLGHEK